MSLDAWNESDHSSRGRTFRTVILGLTIIVGLIILNALVNMLVNSIWPVGENPLKLLMRVGTGFTLGMFITAYYASKTQ